MKEKHYIYITEFFRKTNFRKKTLQISSKYLPILIVIIYIISIVVLFLKKDSKLFLFIVIPAIDFILVSISRKYINAERPYDKYNYKPLVKFKHGKGKSFPSRHTSSAFIIGMGCLYCNLYLGIFVLFISLLIGLTRIFSGVHFIKDVLAGMMISIILGLLCFFII